MFAFTLGNKYRLPFVTAPVAETQFRGSSRTSFGVQRYDIPIWFHVLACNVTRLRVANDNNA